MKRNSVYAKFAALSKAWRKRKVPANNRTFRPLLEGLERRDMLTTLGVTAFNATATGFNATFNEPFNPALINLYDTAGTWDLTTLP